MKQVFSAIILVCLLASCNQEKNTPLKKEINNAPEYVDGNFAIVIHGGAGTIKKENLTPDMEAAYNAKLTEAVSAGHTILKDGGTAIDAVQASIMIMEDSELFNAGKGAVFTNDEQNELDASIMDGSTLNAGAVAGVHTIKNPITLAHAVMTRSEHVMMSGAGAEAFARANEIEEVSPSYFHTDRRFQSLQRAKKREQVELDHDDQTAFHDPFIKDNKYGTVGCVALDLNGNIAAGTSTGGMTNKRYDRIGDAPIIGAGTYANNATCGVSGTGHGEYYIRGVVAYDISAMMEYGNMTLQDAARIVIQEKQPALGGSGGIVALDRAGNVSMEFNTAGMYRAHMDREGNVTIGMYKE